MGHASIDIRKDIEKRKYAASPLGKLEKKVRAYWDKINTRRMELSNDALEKIKEIRNENEQWNLDYIERTNLEHRKAVDDKLFESMTKELAILEANESTTE